MDRFLLFLSGSATPFPRWRMSFIVAGANPVFHLHLSSRYELISYSSRLQELVDRLPSWATIAGEGEGMIRVDTTWTI
jgi:hypothetical protein